MVKAVAKKAPAKKAPAKKAAAKKAAGPRPLQAGRPPFPVPASTKPKRKVK